MDESDTRADRRSRIRGASLWEREAAGEATDADRERLDSLKVTLDQCGTCCGSGARCARPVSTQRPHACATPTSSSTTSSSAGRTAEARQVTRRQRLTLVAAILGSGVATLDGTIVNVALPAIERDLGGGLTGSAVGGERLSADARLSDPDRRLARDIYGRAARVHGRGRRVRRGLRGVRRRADVARADRRAALQGLAGALLTPSSLAIIIAHVLGAGTWPRDRSAGRRGGGSR